MRTENILFLLDEPASNLHTSAQIKILEAISELSKKSLVVYSTHSQHLIKIDWLGGAYVIINDTITDSMLKGSINYNESEIVKIQADKYFNYVGQGHGSDKMSYFQPILDALEYIPSSLEAVPNIIILEGRDDWYTFNYFSQVILKSQNGFNFYPGGGATKLFDIIRLYLSWGNPFLVLLDGDQEGELAKNSYIDEFGEIVEDKIFTLKDISGNECSAEQLIEEQDQEIIYEDIFPSGSLKKISRKKSSLKKNLNLAIRHLFIDKKSVSIGKLTTKNFEDVFSFIESKL